MHPRPFRRPQPGKLIYPPSLALRRSRNRAEFIPFMSMPGGFWSFTRRRRTRFTRSDLKWLGGRRNLARQCRALGFAHIGLGVWYNPDADCSYSTVIDWQQD